MTSDSSSSDDEDTTKIKEALDASFITNQMYMNLNKDITKKASAPNKNVNCTEKSEKQISLRPDRNNDQEEFNILNVTPEFQTFVAKNLTKLLDKEIDLYTSKKKISLYDNTGGIKLFSNSNSLLKDNESYDYECTKIKHKKSIINKRKIDDDDDTKEDFNAKIKAVAVSPDDILSKKDTLFWSKRTKRKPFIYKKLSNGKLELID